MCSSLLETPRGAEFEMVPRTLSQQVPKAGTSVYKVVVCIHNMNQGSSWSKYVALLSRASIVLSVEDKNRREYLEPQLMGWSEGSMIGRVSRQNQWEAKYFYRHNNSRLPRYLHEWLQHTHARSTVYFVALEVDNWLASRNNCYNPLPTWVGGPGNFLKGYLSGYTDCQDVNIPKVIGYFVKAYLGTSDIRDFVPQMYSVSSFYRFSCNSCSSPHKLSMAKYFNLGDLLARV